MATLSDIQSAAPEIGAFLTERLGATGLCFLATTRRDGWPRVSPIEISAIGGRLYVGSMPGAMKARDLQRDPRCCIITPLADREDLAGEAKAFCRAREVTGGPEWDEVRAAFSDAVGVDIGEPGGAHVFELDVEQVAWQRVEGDAWRTSSWSPGLGARERIRRGPTGLSEEL